MIVRDIRLYDLIGYIDGRMPIIIIDHDRHILADVENKLQLYTKHVDLLSHDVAQSGLYIHTGKIIIQVMR